MYKHNPYLVPQSARDILAETEPILERLIHDDLTAEQEAELKHEAVANFKAVDVELRLLPLGVYDGAGLPHDDLSFAKLAGSLPGRPGAGCLAFFVVAFALGSLGALL